MVFNPETGWKITLHWNICKHTWNKDTRYDPILMLTATKSLYSDKDGY